MGYWELAQTPPTGDVLGHPDKQLLLTCPKTTKLYSCRRHQNPKFSIHRKSTSLDMSY